MESSASPSGSEAPRERPEARGRPPNPFAVAVKYGIGAALAALVCCVAPAVLVLLGLMSGVAALSFTGWFYNEDGSASWAGWLLRGLALGIGVLAVVLYRRKQNQCSIDPGRRRTNLLLLVATLAGIGALTYQALDRASTAAFEGTIAPLQQRELIAAEIARTREAHSRGERGAVEEHLAKAEAIVQRAAEFRTKRGTALFDREDLARLRAPIDEARRQLSPVPEG